MNPLRYLYLIFCLYLFQFSYTYSQTYSDQPNILWISVEDMSPRLGCYGDKTVPTPNIDRLAREGVRYTHAFATYGVCAPSRHSIITGMYPTSTGAMHMRNWKRTSAIADITDPKLLNIPTYEAVLPTEARCFSEFLRINGYFCTNNSKTDYQFSPPLSAWDENGREAHWRHRPDPNMPFFAVFNNTTPHESGIHRQRSPALTDPANISVPPYYPDTDTVRRDMARHYDNIRAMDQWVGDLLDQLASDDLLDKTIIFFFSDHGDGLPRAKRWVYDSGIHIPLIVRWPDGYQAGQTTNRLVSFIDFAPTILSLVDIPIPDYMEGSAFLGTQAGNERSYIYAFRDRMDPTSETIRAVRDHTYKYVRNYRPELPYIGFLPYRNRAPMMKEILQMIEMGSLGPDQWQFSSQQKPLEELYDLERDPHEIHNLASDVTHLDKLIELREAHLSWEAAHEDLGMLPEEEVVRKLWPPEGIQPTTLAPIIQREGNQVSINCETEGASTIYRFGEHDAWKLYTEPFNAPVSSEIEALSHRIGWKESPVVGTHKAGVFLGQGAMVGRVTEKSALIQTRLTASPEPVAGELKGIEGLARLHWYKKKKQNTTGNEDTFQWVSAWKKADPEQDHIIKFYIDDLEVGQTYGYDIEFGLDSLTSRFSQPGTFNTLRGATKSDSVSLVVVTGMNYYHFHFGKYDASKAYAGAEKRSGYPALASILQLRPDYFIGTGDNVYFDHPNEKGYQNAVEKGQQPAPGHFEGKEVTDEAGMRRKYHLQFSQSNFKKLFAQVATYWEKDDHDYRYNDADPFKSFPISHALGIKNFREQLPVVIPGQVDAQTYETFRMNQHLQIWLVEGRDFRSANNDPDGPNKTIWGAEQMSWLKASLLNSNATFKILISPTPLVGPDDAYKKDNHTNPEGFKHEGDAFFQWVKQQQLIDQHFYIICGDRHWQYHAVHPSGVEEFSCGALVDNNSRAGRVSGDKHSTDPEGRIHQLYVQRTPEEASGGFLHLSVSEKDGLPTAMFSFYDEKGKLRYRTTRTSIEP